MSGRHCRSYTSFTRRVSRALGKNFFLRRTLRQTIAAATTVTLALMTLSIVTLVTATPAQAAAGTPGVPAAPTVLYQENFENGTGLTTLSNYVSSNGMTYTADPYWLNTTNCNGFVVSSTIPYPNNGYCQNNVNNDWGALTDKAYALGLLNTPQNPSTNRVLSTDTSVPNVGPSNAIEFATASQLSLPSANGRFVTFSVDAAANYCGTSAPLLSFFLRTATGTEVPVTSSAINPCTDPRSKSVTGPHGYLTAYGHFPASASVLFTGSSLGVVLRNGNGASLGNDGAIDNVEVLDVTPQLDKSFSPTSIPVGGVSRLTFTVTNTSELAAKNGWSFTDSLPAGLAVAAAPGVGGTCTASTSAAAGGSSIVVSNGQLTRDRCRARSR